MSRMVFLSSVVFLWEGNRSIDTIEYFSSDISPSSRNWPISGVAKKLDIFDPRLHLKGCRFSLYLDIVAKL